MGVCIYFTKWSQCVFRTCYKSLAWCMEFTYFYLASNLVKVLIIFTSLILVLHSLYLIQELIRWAIGTIIVSWSVHIGSWSIWVGGMLLGSHSSKYSLIFSIANNRSIWGQIAFQEERNDPKWKISNILHMSIKI